MPKRDLRVRIDERPVVVGGVMHAATVVQVSQLAMTSPFSGDFQIIDDGRLIVGDHPDLGERVVIGKYGALGYDTDGVNTFAVLARNYGPWGAGDVFAGYISGNFLLFDQSEGTLGVYSPAGAGFIAAADGSLFAGDTDGAHMRWNTATRAIEVRNGEDVKISLDANGDGFFDGTVYASGGRIYGQMQVDGLLRVGDVDGPSVSMGRFERLNDDDELIESGEIVATDASNMPWFRVVAGGDTANGGYFHLGGTGDYAGRMTFDGARLSVANWTVDSEALVSPTGYIRLDTVEGIVLKIVDETVGGGSLEDIETTLVGTEQRFRAISFVEDGVELPIQRIYASRYTDSAVTINGLIVQGQVLDIASRGFALFGSISDMEAWTQIRAVGGYNLAAQQETRIDLYAYRGESTVFDYRRIDLLTDALLLQQYTSATAFGGTVADGTFLHTDGTYDPGKAGEGLYFRVGGVFKRLALAGDGWKTVAFADSPYTAANIQYLPCNTAAGAITVNLPVIADKPQDWQYTFKLVNATNAATIYPNGSETIEGAASYALTTLNQFVTIRRRTTNWDIIAKG